MRLFPVTGDKTGQGSCLPFLVLSSSATSSTGWRESARNGNGLSFWDASFASDLTNEVQSLQCCCPAQWVFSSVHGFGAIEMPRTRPTVDLTISWTRHGRVEIPKKVYQ
ncbi:hypothetical protein BDW69DRAFT_172591 [Aspergillus filifer]